MLTLPTRDFTIVVDPACFETLLTYPRGALTLVTDLAGLEPPINIIPIFPTYLATEDQRDLAEGWVTSSVDPFVDEAAVAPLTLTRDLHNRHRARIERGAEGDCRGLRLLALADHLKADGIVTAIASLVDARYALLRHHKFRIVAPGELSDFVEVCARGHGVSCAAPPAVPKWLPPDVLYQFTHWKGARLCNWFNKVGGILPDETLREHLRSALLNRYPFILYSRDMIRFFELQKDYHSRRGRQQVFRAPLNYHLTAFYAHVWGMLDTLAGIANRRLALGVSPRQSGMVRDEFLKALTVKKPALLRFIKRHGANWISVIGDVRHPVAHSALRLQHDIVTATEESRKTDEEITAILRREEPEMYRMFPPDLVTAIEPNLIWHWRMNNMKVISDDAIHIQQEQGGYFRHPVASIDFDLEMLNAFIDAFLFACFAHPPATAGTGI